MEERDWYDTPHFYDIIFDEDTATEATFLEVMHLRHGKGNGKPGRVLEPACGSGRLILEMAKRGWRVSGFDQSEAMLEYARERLKEAHLRARLWADRMENFSLPQSAKPFDLAHCLVSTFKYLNKESDAACFLERVSEALKPGGIFVLGLHLTNYQKPTITHERWVAERDGVKVTCNTRTWPVDKRTRFEPLRSRLKIELPDGSLRQQETHWKFRTYSAFQLRALLRKVPQFQLVACHDFHHDPESTRCLDDTYADIVLVLRRSSE